MSGLGGIGGNQPRCAYPLCTKGGPPGVKGRGEHPHPASTSNRCFRRAANGRKQPAFIESAGPLQSRMRGCLLPERGKSSPTAALSSRSGTAPSRRWSERGNHSCRARRMYRKKRGRQRSIRRNEGGGPGCGLTDWAPSSGRGDRGDRPVRRSGAGGAVRRGSPRPPPARRLSREAEPRRR